MDFSINFMSKVTTVLKEAFLLKKYKAMPKPYAIAVGVLMLPLLLASLLSALFLNVMGYLFSICSLPVHSLHKLLKEEGQSVQHATQVVIYLVSWGFVFGSYVALSFLMIWLSILYSVFSITTYLWSLGGFKFHLFAKEEDISVEVEGNYNFLVPVIFIGVMAILLIVIPLIGAIVDCNAYNGYQSFGWCFRINLNNTNMLRFLFSAVYSAAVFAPAPKKAEKVEQAEQIEE